MKLYGSSRSPFVRKVRIAAHETGTEGAIVLEPVVVTALAANPTMLAVNPLGQIPTLVLDDGTVLYDSAVICRYLDRVLGQGRLHPSEPAAEVAMMRLLALGDGLIEVALRLLSELSRQQPDHSDRRLAALHQKLPLIFAALDQEAVAMMLAPFDMAQIAVTAGLCYFDFRLSAHWAWRETHPALAEWFATVSQRPSVVATTFHDELASGEAGREQKVGQA